MADKFMYIPNNEHKFTPSVDYDEWLKRLDTYLNEPSKQIVIKVHKIVKLTKTFFYNTLGTRERNNLLSPSSLTLMHIKLIYILGLLGICHLYI